jgi:hypothetical protein
MFQKPAQVGHQIKIHTPAIPDCEPIPPDNRAQLEFDWTTPPKSTVHGCAHESPKPSNHAASRAGDSK